MNAHRFRKESDGAAGEEVFIIIALVIYVALDNKPAGSTDIEKYALGGLTAQDPDRGVAERIRKVGAVKI